MWACEYLYFKRSQPPVWQAASGTEQIAPARPLALGMSNVRSGYPVRSLMLGSYSIMILIADVEFVEYALRQ
jgi:hypothetical protein